MAIKKRAPSGVVDVLRLLVVVFFAGLGYEVSKRFNSGAFVLGPLNGVMVGVIIGSGLGYVLGGVLGRTTVTVVGRTEHSLRQTSAEDLVAGSFGGVIGVLVGAGVAWWIFLLLQPFLAFPLFGFVVLVIGYLGYRLGTSRREEMLGMFASRAGMGPRPIATSNLPRIVDTSIAIDGRVIDVVRAGFLHGSLLVPSPVLAELQGLADAGDDIRRSKGRRGLQNLEALKREPGVTVEVLEDDVPGVPDVDAKLVRLCLDRGLPLLTLDTNLAKVAALAGVHVMNLHGLALALRPPVSAGDDVVVHLLRPGKEQGQAVGYLDDGTMVVAERSRDHIGDEVAIHVTSVLTTANGRMVFGQPVLAPSTPAAPAAAAAPAADVLSVQSARPGPPSHPLGRSL
ncbi:MAG TPA: hypothetical protein VK662_09050 [Acidothermaceae bacterium]|jgi:uncharacterized protein YacL|nr:hypothetical protein [Acidothermaceae bacterium]